MTNFFHPVQKLVDEPVPAEAASNFKVRFGAAIKHYARHLKTFTRTYADIWPLVEK